MENVYLKVIKKNSNDLTLKCFFGIKTLHDFNFKK